MICYFKPCIEGLEPHYALSVLVSDLVAGDIHSYETYDLDSGDPAPYTASPPSGLLVITPNNLWGLAQAIQQVPMDPDVVWNPQPMGSGQWHLTHVVWGGNQFVASFVTQQLVNLPNAISVGLLLRNDGSLTIYQQTPGKLWSITTHDDGAGWGQWQQLADLTAAQIPVGLATDPIPLAYLESPEPWTGWQWGDPIPTPVPEVVYPFILPTVDGVRFGFESSSGQRLVGVVQGSLFTVEELDSFWSQGTWKTEVEILWP